VIKIRQLIALLFALATGPVWADGASNAWPQAAFPEYGFSVGMPCQPNAVETKKVEGLVISRCEIGGNLYLVVAGEADKLTFGGRVKDSRYDNVLSGAKNPAVKNDGFTLPDEQLVMGLRSFTTKQVKSGGVIYNRWIELDADHILMLADGCSPNTNSAGCNDDETMHSDALKFFGSFGVSAK